MVQDVRIYDGTTWQSLKGATGPAGPSAVSTNAGQLAKLGSDNLVLVAAADLNTRYVQKIGDTMTGTLVVRAASGTASQIQLLGENAPGNAVIDTYGAAASSVVNMRRYRGTAAAPEALVSLDPIGVVNAATNNAAGAGVNVGQMLFRAVNAPAAGEPGVKTRVEFLTHSGIAVVTPCTIADTGISVTGSVNVTTTGTDAAVSKTGLYAVVSGPSKISVGLSTDVAGGTTQNVGLQIGPMTGATAPYAILSYTVAPALFNGGMSLGGFVTLTGNRKLDVTGDAIVRGILETTGNISSTGTAHSFVANSIPASAISGLPVASAAAGLTDTVSGTVGTSAAYARADHTHQAMAAVFYQASRTLTAADVGKIVVNNYSGAATNILFTLPAAGDTTIPVGSWINIYDASANSTTGIQAPAGVTLQYNLVHTGSASTLGGGVGAAIALANPFSRAAVLKISANGWVFYN